VRILNKSKIEWCDSTWNPVTGCLHGCEYCYAKRIAERFAKTDWKCENCCIAAGCEFDHSIQDCYMQYEKIHDIESKRYLFNPKRMLPYPFGFEPTFHRYRLDEPKLKTKPQNIFVCSMADLFGEWVPDEWIEKVFNVVLETSHRYLFLTKNPKKYNAAMDYFENEERGVGFSEGYWDNCWFGTTVTHQKDMERVKHLETFSEGHKFLSIEPLLEEINIDLSGVRCPECGSVTVYQDNPNTTPKGMPPYYCDDCGEWEGEEPAKLIEWVIVGAQTGPGAKPPEPEWVQNIINQCRDAKIPLFLKNNLNWPVKIQEFPWDEHKDCSGEYCNSCDKCEEYPLYKEVEE